MAQTIKDSFLDLERHRQLLEENIEKLRKSLRHWQTWEAEYEGLKEEILAVEPTPDRDQLVIICREYQGELVTPKEVEEILGVNTRTTAQVVNLLDRRIDYVEQNVRTVQKQVDTAESKLAAATIISDPDVRNEEGLPMTEILEELDEDGNVINSRLTTPGSAKPQLLEVLEKAGVNLPAAEPAPLTSTPTPSANLPSSKTGKEAQPAGKPKSTKKAVKFAEDTKSGPEVEKTYTAKRVEAIMELAKAQNQPPTEPPVIPTDDTPEDAALRREMLQYGLSEVGAVVAELDLEEGSDWDDEEWDDDDDDESEDDEDQYGRSTGRLVDEDLRAQMIELEKKLGVRMMENIGKKASDYEVVEEGIGRITINGKEEESTSKSNLKSTSETKETDTASSSERPAKKSVKFSEDLDIAPSSEPPSATPTTTTRNAARPISDIVERKAPSEVTSPQPQKKASRFKSARASNPTPIPRIINGPLSGNSSLTLQPAKPSTPKPFSQPIPFTDRKSVV